ncbi:MAG: UDP-N-acetylmuramate--L-alanine ligase [Candidatus Avoscillospira sp.]
MNPSSAKKTIADYLKPGMHAHLVGIGGVSMRPLGLVLRAQGMIISGSDMNASVSTDELIEKGITVYIGHKADNIQGADCIIRTAAAHNDNPEIAAARAQGIPVFERAQAWGVIMRNYQNAICISGTHGKTTTTSMITHIFMEAQKDPTVMIGGTLPLIHAGHRVGSGDTIILESCEYCNSFLNFFPTVALILNIEADHLDFFKDLADIQASFRKFAQLVPENGRIIANGDDRNTRDALEGLDYLTFGLTEGNDVHGENYSADWRTFDVVCEGTSYAHVHLSVVGRHNALNAIAACAAAWNAGLPGDVAERALARFTGAGRRMEFKGRYNGADVYDDYAHHPGELHALLTAARSMGYERIICAFQPHTYTRTKALFDDFVRELKTVDVPVLTDIYAARERNLIGISSKMIADQIEGAVYCPSLQDVTAYLREAARPGDLILTVGAGDIYKAGDALLKEP